MFINQLKVEVAAGIFALTFSTNKSLNISPNLIDIKYIFAEYFEGISTKK